MKMYYIDLYNISLVFFIVCFKYNIYINAYICCFAHSVFKSFRSNTVLYFSLRTISAVIRDALPTQKCITNCDYGMPL